MEALSMVSGAQASGARPSGGQLSTSSSNGTARLCRIEATIRHALMAFAFFRLFDITKPAPARQLERLHGGLGIMMDDVAAGVYALLACLIVHHWW